jgi:two-component system response regulator
MVLEPAPRRTHSVHAGAPIILVAENDAQHRFVLRRVFRAAIDLEAELRFVTNGQELLDYLEGKGEFAQAGAAPWPDLVLLDLHMPQLDGLSALEMMRAHPRMRGVPTIMFSSSDQAHHIDRAYASGANAYLVKVGDFKELVAELQHMIAFWFKAARLPRQPGPPDDPPAPSTARADR